jgi:hypothetical protein
MSDKVIHMIQFFGLLTTGLVLILFGHQWISPDLVFTSMIAGTASVMGSRIVANGYQKPPNSNEDKIEETLR